MINFEEELKKFHPSLEIDEAEDVIINHNMTDFTDILVDMVKEQEKEKRTAYEAMRSEQQFETEEDFQNACMKPAELERREKALEAYEEQLRQSRQEVDWLRQQLKGKETPDLAQTESELKEQKEQQRMQERELRKLYSRRETNQQAVRKLQQLTKEREELRKRYQVLNTLTAVSPVQQRLISNRICSGSIFNR